MLPNPKFIIFAMWNAVMAWKFRGLGFEIGLGFIRRVHQFSFCFFLILLALKLIVQLSVIFIRYWSEPTIRNTSEQWERELSCPQWSCKLYLFIHLFIHSFIFPFINLFHYYVWHHAILNNSIIHQIRDFLIGLKKRSCCIINTMLRYLYYYPVQFIHPLSFSRSMNWEGFQLCYDQQTWATQFPMKRFVITISN